MVDRQVESGTICRFISSSVVGLLSSVTHVLWLKRTSKRVAMGTLDRAITSFYRLSIVTMSLSAAVWLQFSMQSCYLQPIILVHRIAVSYPSVDCSVRCSSVIMAYRRLSSLWPRNRFFSRPLVGHWPSDRGSTVGPL